MEIIVLMMIASIFLLFPCHSFVLISKRNINIGRAFDIFSRKVQMTTNGLNEDIGNINEKVKKEIDTGGFKRSKIPNVYPGTTHFKRALKSLKLVKTDSSIKNQRNKYRKHAAESLDTIMKSLTMPITAILDSYMSMLQSLHPYEAAVADLTITARVKAGSSDLRTTLQTLKNLRKLTSETAKDYASKANLCETSIEAKELLSQGLEELEQLYETSEEAKALADLAEIQKDLRNIPVIELELPTCVLVGAPNVGKSSIVRAVSSGTPEVNDYPFTTRGVTIGHIVDEIKGIRFQVMDTPGLLDRPEEERNEMERLTFASLAHLPTAVIFVIDPTGLSGEKSTLLAQLNVRKYLKSRFPRRPWIDVISKGDIKMPEFIQELLPPEHISVSVKTGQNIELLKQEIEGMLYSLQDFLISRANKKVS